MNYFWQSLIPPTETKEIKRLEAQTYNYIRPCNGNKKFKPTGSAAHELSRRYLIKLLYNNLTLC
jgi:hypothetical protein